MKLFISMLLLHLITSCALAASGEAEWWFTGKTRAILSTRGSSDGFVTHEDMAPIPGEDGWVAGSYRINGIDGWNYKTGFYSYDRRSPLAVGQTKTWMLYIWALPGFSPQDFGVAWNALSASNILGRLEYVQKPAGVVGGPDVGTIWTTPPAGAFTLPYYSSSDGLTGHGFKFTLTMIPEPASILSLGIAVSGLGAMIIRRRCS